MPRLLGRSFSAYKYQGRLDQVPEMLGNVGYGAVARMVSGRSTYVLIQTMKRHDDRRGVQSTRRLGTTATLESPGA
jgi:hypothetical protein